MGPPASLLFASAARLLGTEAHRRGPGVTAPLPGKPSRPGCCSPPPSAARDCPNVDFRHVRPIRGTPPQVPTDYHLVLKPMAGSPDEVCAICKGNEELRRHHDPD